MKTSSRKITKNQWDNLKYPMSLRALSEEEGGGWLATIPMLGQAAFMAHGDTPQSVVEELEVLRRDLYEDVVSAGVPIPMPEDGTDAGRVSNGAGANGHQAKHPDHALPAQTSRRAGH